MLIAAIALVTGGFGTTPGDLLDSAVAMIGSQRLQSLNIMPDRILNAVIGFAIGFYLLRSLRRFSLRRRWTQVGVVAARDLEEAERRFFESWDGSATSVPPAAAWAPSMPVAPASPDVLGLFPQPGPRG